MNERILGKTYIKEWRKKRGISLRKLEGRLETSPGGEPLITHVSINRIENGEQPYSQEILEALAVALDCTPADLISVNPFKEGEVVDLMRHLSGDKYEQAIEFLKFLNRAG